jgi:hypothetical protein
MKREGIFLSGFDEFVGAEESDPSAVDCIEKMDKEIVVFMVQTTGCCH